MRGDTVIIEWQTIRIVDGNRLEWRGVDKFRIQDGKTFGGIPKD